MNLMINKFLSEKIKSKLILNFAVSIFFIIVIPVSIWLFLSIPRIYYSSFESDFETQFTTSYINLNLNYTYTLLSILVLIWSFSKKISKYLIFIFFIIIFIIRSFDFGLKKNFGISYSTIVFNNVSWDSFNFFINNYFLHIIFTITVGLFLTLILVNLITFILKRLNSTTLIICVLIAFLLGLRSTYILYQEKKYSFEVISLFLLFKELSEYNDYINYPKIVLKEKELTNLKKVGVYPSSLKNKEFKNNNARKNLVVIYLESFSRDYLKIGGSIFDNLTPNLDEFAKESSYFPNYRSSAPGTHESMISSFCGIYALIGPEYIRNNPEYTRGLNCIFDILQKSEYQQFFYVGHHLGYSGLKKFFNRNDIRIIDSSYFERNHPQWIRRGHEWGIQDTDLAKFLVEILPQQISKEKPYFLGSFFINTHGPFFTASDCKKYGNYNDAHLNAIYCVDQAFGYFWKELSKTGLLDNTVIMVLGDTPGVNLKTGKGALYGNPLMLIHDSDSHPSISNISFHTPDVGATLLELIGFDVQSMNFGHSIISSRKRYPVLFGPTYRIDHNTFFEISNCSPEEFVKTTLEDLEITSNSCQHNKLFKYTHEWVVEQDIQVKL